VIEKLFGDTINIFYFHYKQFGYIVGRIKTGTIAINKPELLALIRATLQANGYSNFINSKIFINKVLIRI